MALDERSRHGLHSRLQEVLGADEAAVLMEYLPPVGWADVANKRDLDQLAFTTKRDLDKLAFTTKRDLDQTRDELIARIDACKYEVIAVFRAELNAALSTQTRNMMLTMSGLMVSLAGLAFAAARLV